MSLLDERMLALRGQAEEWSVDLRTAGLELDRDPDAIGRFVDRPAVRCLAGMMIPPEYGGEGIRVGKHRFFGMSALERAVVLEEFACGDAGMMLAAPGASMSGVLVDVLADEHQKRWFYGRLLDRPTWTFFALTEPGAGSDASAMRTELKAGEEGSILTGRKKFVGNASRASVGAVFARTGPGPLGVTAVLVDTASPGFTAEPLNMIGLRGARICELTLDAVAVPDDRVLGRHLSPTRRGMWACVQTFNRLRPGVAAIAVGIARAAWEYVLSSRQLLTFAERARLAELGQRIGSVRALVLRAAMEVDANASRGHLGSAAKAKACRLAEESTIQACEFFGPGARLEHPLLDKLVRDARGVEFMEGTGNIQKLNVFHGLLTGKVPRGNPFPSSTGGSSCA